MKHDTLCPAHDVEKWSDVDECGPCQHIARIREDERDRAVKRVRSSWDKWHAFIPAERHMLLQAVRGEPW